MLATLLGRVFAQTGYKKMVRNTRGLQILKPVLLMCALMFNASSLQASEPLLTSVDRDIPDFSLKMMDGEVIDTEALKGKTWLINFWAVWCAPCLEELPSLNSAWEKLEPHNVGMLAINIGEEADQIQAFLAEHNLAIDFPIVIGDKIRTLGNWSVRALPHTVVIGPEGRIVFEASGPREWDDQAIIDAIIALSGES